MGSQLHLIGVDTHNHGVISLDRVAGITDALDHIASYVTHQEEDPAVSDDVVREAWTDHLANGGGVETFTFGRGRGLSGYTVYSLIFTEA